MEAKCVVAISDLHFGLRGKELCMPQEVADFIEFLKRLERGERITVKLGAWGHGREEKVLRAPDKLILMGDIIELWDATDRSIDVCWRPIMQAMAELKCEKIYLLGNHDIALMEIAGRYALGESPMAIINGVYPEQIPVKGVKGKVPMQTIKIGNRHYLFLHGHQFDWLFRRVGLSWVAIALLRDGSEAFGLYSWVLSGLFLLTLIAWIIRPSSFTLTLLVPIMAVLGFPRIFTSIARPAWNKVFKTRYNRKKALKGFLGWWRWFTKKREYPPNLTIVYGHTHLADVMTLKEVEKITGMPSEAGVRERAEIQLINTPSWIKVKKEKYMNVLRAVFFYADEEGGELLGWDWRNKRPFLIPRDVVMMRRNGLPIPEKIAKELIKIGWPERLVKEWGKPIAL